MAIFEKNDTQSLQLAAAVSSISFVIMLGTVIFHTLEDWTWAQSFYFTVVTATTVGYGDLHPTSDASRMAAAFFILFGVSIIITGIGYTGSHFMSRQGEIIRKNRSKRSK